MAHNEYPIDIAHVKDGRPSDGSAVLVDRVWPRGQRKDGAPWDEWLKAVAPSTELRKWYGHDRDKQEEFARRYRAELDGRESEEALEHLKQLHHNGHLTLLTATKELELSQARILANMLVGT